MEPRERILVALDTPDPARALETAGVLRGRVGGFKIGLELFTAGGPEIVERIRDGGDEVFVDLKLHDIPNTVGGAAATVARLGVSFFTMHALGGRTMLRTGVERARAVAAESGFPAPTALAVTVLTSHSDDDLSEIGVDGPCGTAVERLAALARSAGVGGLVCSPLELQRVRAVFPSGTLVVPGIRPAGSDRGDQARTATPAVAVARGADRLVIGRPITRAENPAAAAEAIALEIAEGPGR
jgi:orotidine-5'-phosphate decarboxylase